MKSVFKGLFLIIIIALLIACIFFVFYLYVPENWEIENTVTKTATQLMLYYLIVIFVRTFIILVLSFMELLSTKKKVESHVFPLVTLIVPCYNEGKVLDFAIGSILTIDYPNIEILIVDDGSKDDTFEVAKKLEAQDDRIRVIYQDNGGKSHALNNGISQAQGDYFVCMDADSILSKNILIDSIPYFELDSKLAAVAGAVVVGNAKNLLTYFQKLEYIIGLNFHKMAQSFLSMVTIVPGPIGIFKKSVVIEIGGYSGDTFAEDSDLSMRLLMAGYNIKYTGKITATTEAPDEINQLITQRYRWSRGMIQSIMKALRLAIKKPSVRSFSLIAYMYVETIIIPVVNFLFIILTLEYALIYETTELMGPYFIGLTIMDVTLCLYSVVIEKQIFHLLILGTINKVTYGLALEVIRFYAVVDEVFKLPMKWGVLVRKGLK